MGGGVGSRKQFTKSTDYCHGLHSIYSQIAGLVPGNGGNPKLMIIKPAREVRGPEGPAR